MVAKTNTLAKAPAKRAARKVVKKTARKAARKPRAKRKPKGDIYGIGDGIVERFPSGSTLLDCVLGGGWCFHRTANIVGDTSTFKTGLVVEAMANFKRTVKTRWGEDCRIIYIEAESKFDTAYAQAIGFPVDTVELPNSLPDPKQHMLYIQQIFKFIEKLCKPPRKGSKPKPLVETLIVIDSLDGVQSDDDDGNEAGKGYRLTKQKVIGELFERLSDKMAKNKITLMIVNQVREDIGALYGDGLRRSGGKALDFYATHALWLSKVGAIWRTRNKVKRVVGTWIKGKAKKNHAGPPQRECKFPIFFYYGIEDLQANLSWIYELKQHKAIGISSHDALKKIISKLATMDLDDYDKLEAKAKPVVIRLWQEIEESFMPPRRKYR